MNIWNRDNLHKFAADQLKGQKLIVVSNREPWIHVRSDGRLQCTRPASGLTSAIDPVLRASGGVWVAHGSGNGDREVVDSHDRIAVPPEAPAYTLRRVWLSETLEREYYYGLANEGLWPLCHAAFHRPHFSERNWNSYQQANELFANAVLEEADGQPAIVFIQDYHFALLSRMIKRRNPLLTVAHFWHIPWPNCHAFSAFPWKEELLDGMLGNDLIGFHTPEHCTHFAETVDRVLGTRCKVEEGNVRLNGHNTVIRAFPISTDFEAHAKMASGPRITMETAKWAQVFTHPPEILGIGVDRIDYTKGISNRLQAIDLLFEEHPEYVGRFTFLQVGVPSRSVISAYATLEAALADQVAAINAKWGHSSWKPVVFIRRHFDLQALTALYLMADFCLVSSLHDGMNLVAKEFVSSRVDGDGVLILSEFTGAARELTDALSVNPFSADAIAHAMHEAIRMPAAIRRRRINRMRAIVAENNVYRWAADILQTIATLQSDAGELEVNQVATAA